MGDLIQKSSFQTNWSYSWTPTLSDKDKTRFIYISATSFQLTITSVKSTFNYGTITLYAWYYNWNTGSWVQTINGSKTNKGNSYTFYHNVSGNESGVSNYHLWKFQYRVQCNGSSKAKFAGYAGGPGHMSDSQYTNYCKGRYIVSAGRLGADCFAAYDSSSDSTVVSLFNWSSNTGAKITADYAEKCMPKSWV